MSTPGNTARHDRYRVYAALMIVVYPLGMPLALGWWLFRHREELRDPGRKNNFRIRPAADLWGSYTRERYYYEVRSPRPFRVHRESDDTFFLSHDYSRAWEREHLFRWETDLDHSGSFVCQLFPSPPAAVPPPSAPLPPKRWWNASVE